MASTSTDPADEAGGEVVYSSDGLSPTQVTKPPEISRNKNANMEGDEAVLDSDDYITPQTAFEVFQGKVYSVQTTTKPARAASAGASASAKAEETPLEKLARLQTEVSELEAQLQTTAGTGRDFDEQLVALATSLTTRLTTASSIKSLEHDDLTRLIRQQVQTLQASAKGGDTPTSTSDTDTATATATGVVYELYGNASNPTTTTEDRLVQLERLLGSTSSATHKSLVHRLEELESLVKTVDPVTLEQTATKAKVIRADLEAASKARNKLTATYKKEDSKMIQQLHQQLTELEGVSAYLPQLVERLQQLAGLHVQASSFAARLDSLEGSANQMGATVTHLEGTMEKLQSNLVDNIQTMEGNLKTLDERLNHL
jgi:hypothetical protein